MTAPTPEAFLAQPTDPDEDVDTDAPFAADPLERIASSLERIADSREGKPSGEEDRLRENFTVMSEEIQDLSSKLEAAYGLVADIEKIVKKSTSKLADEVRTTINAWLAPVVEAPAAGTEPETPPGAPAHDADVEEWRAFAAGFVLPEGTDLSQMNRSQIRTLLGIGQTAGAA